jgi:hypothetical protein
MNPIVDPCSIHAVFDRENRYGESSKISGQGQFRQSDTETEDERREENVWRFIVWKLFTSSDHHAHTREDIHPPGGTALHEEGSPLGEAGRRVGHWHMGPPEAVAGNRGGTGPRNDPWAGHTRPWGVGEETCSGHGHRSIHGEGFCRDIRKLRGGDYTREAEGVRGDRSLPRVAHTGDARQGSAIGRAQLGPAFQAESLMTKVSVLTRASVSKIR